jgi:hypothetical protein
MPLRPEITISAQSRKTADSLPHFFHSALNALWDFHLRCGFRNPTLAVHRDEATIVFRTADYSISVIHVLPDQVFFVDSRSPTSERYATSIRIPDDELASRLPQFLNEHTKFESTAAPR